MYPLFVPNLYEFFESFLPVDTDVLHGTVWTWPPTGPCPRQQGCGPWPVMTVECWRWQNSGKLQRRSRPPQQSIIMMIYTDYKWRLSYSILGHPIQSTQKDIKLKIESEHAGTREQNSIAGACVQSPCPGSNLPSWCFVVWIRLGSCLPVISTAERGSI